MALLFNYVSNTLMKDAMTLKSVLYNLSTFHVKIARFDLKSLLESWINIEYKLCADQGRGVGSGAPPLKGKTY